MPLTALCYAAVAVAVADDGRVGRIVAVVAVMAALTLAVHHLLGRPHALLLRELTVGERPALAEHDRFAAVDRLLEHDRPVPGGPSIEELRRR